MSFVTIAKNQTTPDKDIEDIFDQNDDLTTEREFSNRQYKSYSEKFYNEGFREALSDLEDEAKEEAQNVNEEKALQIAFDRGYQSAFSIAKKLSVLSSAAKTYLELKAIELPQDTLKDIIEINIALDTAKDQLNNLVRQNENTIAISDQSPKRSESNKQVYAQQKAEEINKQWSLRLSERLNLTDLEMRCEKLLDLKF